MTDETEHGNLTGHGEFPAGDDGAADAVAADVLGPATATPGRRPRARLLPAVAVVAAAAAVAAVLLAGKYLNGPLSPAAFVTQSAQRTLSQHTARIVLSGTVPAVNQAVPVHGTGAADFATGAIELSLSAGTAGRAASEEEIDAGGAFYLTVAVNGRSISQSDGGRPWVRMPLQQSERAHVSGSDPSSVLSVLEQSGNKVRVLGTKVIGGVTCTGYAVTTSTSAIVAGVRVTLAAGGVPAATANSDLKAIRNMRPPVYTVWISAQGLLRRVSVQIPAFSDPASQTASLVMDFTDYGVPVHITAPAPSRTISYTALQRLESGG